MKPIVVRKKNNPIIMEVIGKDGLKIAEYVDKGDDKLPYQRIIEQVSL